MFEVRQFTSAELDREIAAQVASFIRIVWLNSLQGEDRFWELISPRDGALHFVIAERGVLVSHALLVQRTIVHLGRSYKLLGLGGVMTYPAFRGEGHGRRVVEQATAAILKSDADLGMLFTGTPLFPFYQACGWSPLTRTDVYHSDPEQPKLSEAHMMMQYVSEAAKAHQADFEQGKLFVGEYLW